VAAFVFAYAPPVLAQEGHAQLIYRYAIPLAVLNLWQLLEFRRLDRLPWLAIWMAVQFFCSIYLGLFLAMLVCAMTVASICVQKATNTLPPTLTGKSKRRSVRQFVSICMAVLIWVGLLLMLEKYHAVAKQYGFHRSIDEIQSMVPHLSSYLFADTFRFDAWIGRWAPYFPMRGEHQMFFGVAASILAITSVIIARNSPKWSRITRVSLLGLLMLIIVTSSIGDFSLYRFIMVLPGFSAIRAVTRICLVMLLPVALLVAVSTESLVDRLPSLRPLLILSIIALLTVELWSRTPVSTPIAQWQERLHVLMPDSNSIAGGKSAILFVRSKPSEPLWVTFGEVDGMVLAQDLGIPTVNGYSGNFPPGFGAPDNCMIAMS
jgi:hypothetical protein